MAKVRVAGIGTVRIHPGGAPAADVILPGGAPVANVNVSGVAPVADVNLMPGSVVDGGRYAVYEGGYVVTPAEKAQSLPTRNKIMAQDVTVQPVDVRSLVAAYDGPYSVEPDFAAQTLETSGKLMDDDVTVEPIFTSQVSNDAGGYTFYIGGIF